jgi:tetratricopeptide (TPR) repeat protein
MLQISLGQILTTIYSPAALEVKQALERAKDLVLQVGQAPQNFSIFHGLAYFFMMRGELLTALELGQQFLRQAEQQPDSLPLEEAHRTLGSITLFLGRLTQARAHLEKSIALHQPDQPQAPIFDQSSNAKAVVNLAFDLWILGYPDQSRRRIEESLRLAEAESDPYITAHNHLFAAIVYDFMRDTHEMQRCAEATMSQSAKQGLFYWRAAGAIIYNAALVRQGTADADIVDQMSRDLAIYRGVGAVIGLPYMISLLAAVLGGIGEAGRRAVALR